MLWCDRQALVKSDGFTVEVAALPCKCWDCEHCVELNRRQLKKLAAAGRPDTFVTLTLPDHDELSHDELAQLLVSAFRKLLDRAASEARRNLARWPRPRVPEPRDGWPLDRAGRVPRQVRLDGNRLPFLAVIEEHKSGKPHLHLLARSRWIAVEWLREAWRELTGAHRVNIGRPRTVGGVAFYIASYIKKAPKKFAGCKRYWRSQDWRLEEEERTRCVIDGSSVQVKFHTAATEVHELSCKGYRIVEHKPAWWKLTPGGVPP